jgi:hypothetical protein
MNTNKTVVINGKMQKINTLGVIDLTNKQDIDKLNKQRKESHKKSFSLKFGIRQKPFGDMIDFITRKTGIKWLITKLFKECGCEKRRQYFNKWNLYIPFLHIDNKFPIPIDIKVEKLVTTVLDNGNNEEDKPIPRNLLQKQKKPCSCGANQGI